jgi:flagellar protein FlgJ
MDAAAARQLNALGDPKSLGALRQRPNDTAAARALAGQFAGMLLQRVLQNGNGEAMGMAGGVGGNIVNTMFAGTIAQAAATDPKLGLADLLFRAIEAKQRQAAGGTATAIGTATAAAEAGNAVQAGAGAATGGGATGQGFALAPYWHGNGRRPLDGGGLGLRGAATTARPAITGGAPMPVPQRGRFGLYGVSASTPPLGPSLAPIATTGQTSRSGSASPAPIEDFSRRLVPLLRRAAAQLGVSPKTLLAHAALETGWGRSVVGNNLFGIKAGSSWSGDRVTAATHEVENGQWVPQRAAFRAYPSLDASVQDYVALISGSSRYRAALGLGDDARAYGQALIDGGYATDTTYPNKLATVAAGPSVAAAFADTNPPVASLDARRE